MHSWASWTAKTVLVTTGFAVAGGGLAGAAFAGTGTNAGNVSVLNGNQVSVPVSVPVNICGNAVALLGGSQAGCQGGAQVAGAGALLGGLLYGSPSGDGGLSAGNIGAVSGSVVKIPVDVAANACGNAIGNATAQCQGGVLVPAAGGLLPGGLSGNGIPDGAHHQTGLSAGNVSVGSGNQVQIPVTVPANVCGNAAAILGDSSAGCQGGASVGDHSHQGSAGHPYESADQLAGFGALPGVANLPSLGGLSSLSLLQGSTSGGALLPVSSLSAMQSSVDGGGMGSDSFVALAVGALLAGAAALKLAGLRPGRRGGKSARGEAAA